MKRAFAGALKDAPGTNSRLNLLWIGCGREDSLYSRSEKLSELLKARGVRHTFVPTEDAHTYTVWRRHLAEFVPLLFR